MNAKVLYFTPDFDYDQWSVDALERLEPDELLHLARNSTEVIVYDDLLEFQLAFNNECISDQGFIYFVQ